MGPQYNPPATSSFGKLHNSDGISNIQHCPVRRLSPIHGPSTSCFAVKVPFRGRKMDAASGRSVLRKGPAPRGNEKTPLNLALCRGSRNHGAPRLLRALHPPSAASTRMLARTACYNSAESPRAALAITFAVGQVCAARDIIRAGRAGDVQRCERSASTHGEGGRSRLGRPARRSRYVCRVQHV